MAIRDTRKKTEGTAGHTLLQPLLNNAAVMCKDFGKQDKNGRESMTWKNREIDWYNTERRFIFACRSKNERRSWIRAINTQTR